MKIDVEVPDITQEQVIEAMAARLLGSEYEHSGDADDPTPVPTSWDRAAGRKAIGRHLRVYFEAKITELAAETVRREFDEVIRARIASAVDTVLADGWQQTNQYGERTGLKLDLKARVSEVLTQTRGDHYNRQPSVLDAQVKGAVEAFLGKELQPVIDSAKAELKRQLDAKVMKVVADTVANAVGLR